MRHKRYVLYVFKQVGIHPSTNAARRQKFETFQGLYRVILFLKISTVWMVPWYRARQRCAFSQFLGIFSKQTWLKVLLSLCFIVKQHKIVVIFYQIWWINVYQCKQHFHFKKGLRLIANWVAHIVAEPCMRIMVLQIVRLSRLKQLIKPKGAMTGIYSETWLTFYLRTSHGRLLHKGSSINHVVKILGIFDLMHPFVVTFTK